MSQYLKNIKEKPLKITILLFVGLFLNLLLALESPLFAQVKKYAKIEKTNTTSYNLLDEGKSPEQQKKDKTPYQVYSDRSENPVYLAPYAKETGENQELLTPYYVLDQKNDHLQLVVADPELLGKPEGILSYLFNGKTTFKDAEQVQYVGWIHKNNLLHYNHAKLSEYNYKPMRYTIGVHNSIETLYTIDDYVEKDSVYVFKDPLLKEKSDKKLLLDQFVYLYKYNLNKKAALVANQPQIKPQDSTSRIMGWIPTSLLKEIGQQQAYAISGTNSLTFLKEPKETFSTIQTEEIGGEFIYDLAKHKITPRPPKHSSTVAIPISIWNHYDSELVNIEGESMLVRKLKDIKSDNKRINFHFIFDCGEDARKKQLKLISSLQRLWMQLSTEEKYKGYDFNFSASSYGCKKFYSLLETKSFSLWIDYLQNVFSETNYTPSRTNATGIEQCFEYALSNLPSQSFTNNIILVAGEKQFFSPPNLESITYRLGQTSSRIIFYQLENKLDDQHQEYILQAKDILDRVSTSHTNFVKAFMVENKLLKDHNIFTNIAALDNIYIYDAPDNSNYQGGIVFPKINKVLSATSFDKALDSVLSKTIQFNATFINSLEYHAKNLSVFGTKPGEKIKAMILRDTMYHSTLSMLPKNYIYENYYKDKRYYSHDNPEAIAGYLLSKEELSTAIDNYKLFIPALPEEAEIKTERKKLHRKYKKSSKSINKSLFGKFLGRKHDMADLIFLKTGLPVKSDFLHNTQLKDIKRKGKTSDADFIQIMKELTKKIEGLEEILSKNKTQMHTDGSDKPYYFISINHIL